MASTAEVRADDHALMDDAPAPRYPVDDVGEMKHCELHQPMKNMSFKMAVGTALPCLPGALLTTLSECFCPVHILFCLLNVKCN